MCVVHTLPREISVQLQIQLERRPFFLGVRAEIGSRPVVVTVWRQRAVAEFGSSVAGVRISMRCAAVEGLRCR